MAIGLCRVALPGVALADEPGDAERARERYQDRQRELERIAPPETGVEAPPVKPPPSEPQRCFPIARIIVEGASLFAEEELAARVSGR